ncbi:hypothetical protein DXT99_03485 [Pontibacter diazotrophicus]|uniref:Uncharacterized protein n=2 Tax=Pontibacter diazotrophicus TaxID=1400979 RepID=A0A3D8LGM1_9BACT|nr:hypothetical protein DXT99_03485 [Pontibacter diazotrophicus]
MRPEDIDKLFKERLGNTSPTPPADLWSRLQDRMEEEMPQKAPLQPKEEKRSYMWIYSSVAASISLVLTVGVVFFNINTGSPEINQAITEKGSVELHETPVITQPAPEAMAQADITKESSTEEKNITPQATDANLAASNKAEEDVKTEAIAKATPKAVQQKQVKALTSKQPQATVQQAIAANTPSERAAEAAEAVTVPAEKPVTSTSLAVANADANMNAAPVEIIIKRANTSPTQVAMAETEDTPGGLDKRARLAKNIFKQVRNLASGEEVELSELGINADKVALNTQIGKQKFSKVINL